MNNCRAKTPITSATKAATQYGPTLLMWRLSPAQPLPSHMPCSTSNDCWYRGSGSPQWPPSALFACARSQCLSNRCRERCPRGWTGWAMRSRNTQSPHIKTHAAAGHAQTVRAHARANSATTIEQTMPNYHHRHYPMSLMICVCAMFVFVGCCLYFFMSVCVCFPSASRSHHMTNV